jgi:hypothetical protein
MPARDTVSNDPVNPRPTVNPNIIAHTGDTGIINPINLITANSHNINSIMGTTTTTITIHTCTTSSSSSIVDQRTLVGLYNRLLSRRSDLLSRPSDRSITNSIAATGSPRIPSYIPRAISPTADRRMGKLVAAERTRLLDQMDMVEATSVVL